MLNHNIKYLDNTRISTYRKCPRKFLLRHVFHWTPEGVSIPLAFGSSWHVAMDHLWSGDSLEGALDAWEEHMLSKGFLSDGTSEFMHDLNFTSKYTKDTTKVMLKNYLAKNKNIMETHKTLSIERPFAVPLTKDGVYYVGRLDKVVQNRKEQIKIIEHKTTSAYRKDGPFPPYYLESFSPNSQVDGYLYAGALLYGDKFRGALIDIALVHKTVHDGFYMLPIEKKFELVDAWLGETRLWSYFIRKEVSELIETKAIYEEQPFLILFPRKTEECSSFGGCTYREICKYVPNPLQLDKIPGGFKEEKWEPFSELNLEEIGMKGEEENA